MKQILITSTALTSGVNVWAFSRLMGGATRRAEDRLILKTAQNAALAPLGEGVTFIDAPKVNVTR